MGLSLAVALRLIPRALRQERLRGASGQAVAFVGAGGKTAAMLALAHELPGPTFVTTTTHIGAWQIKDIGDHIVADSTLDLERSDASGIYFVTGPAGLDGRLPAPPAAVVVALRQRSLRSGSALLIEADGARQKPLKAPRSDEPQIPDFSDIVVVVAGLDALGRPLNDDTVHRASIFAALTNREINSPITEECLGDYLVTPQGGLKGIPARARRVALLNQADNAERQSAAFRIARRLEEDFDAVLIGSADSNQVHACVEPVAGIVLAAGGSTRFGSPKQLAPWNGEPLIRSIVKSAVESKLAPVVVVTGAHAEQVEAAVRDLPVLIARNQGWENGQSTSIREGLDACPDRTCAATFLLADQPFVSAQVIRALAEEHASERAAIVAPLIEGDRRGNPVLFDRETFSDLRTLRGDEGGRAVFSKFPVHYMPWHDDRITRDIDTAEDYRQLLEDQEP